MNRCKWCNINNPKYIDYHDNEWGKLKTVTQMIAIILAFVDLNPFGECFSGTLQGGDLILNIIVTGMMIIQTIATIFSGLDYMKGAKKLMKD